MAPPPGATARDRLLDQADQARARMNEARATGDHRTAGL